MTKILMVDDDPIVLRIYQRGLQQRGLAVETATDGLGAIKALRQSRPDAVVLDLMMPNFSGVEVLKFIRADAKLADLPVIVLSNAYMNDLATQAAAIGAQKGLLKVGCNPGLLADCLREVLEGAAVETEPSRLVAAKNPSPPSELPSPTAPVEAAPQAAPPPLSHAFAPVPVEKETAEQAEFNAQAREDFLAHASTTSASLQEVCRAFTEAQTNHERRNGLEALCRKIHFLAGTAGLAGCHRLAQMASVFEAMLYQMMDKSAGIAPSELDTTGRTVEFLRFMLGRAAEPQAPPLPAAQVLVVDDDSLSYRLVVTALRQAQMRARSTPDPRLGFEWLRQHPSDLVLLDIGLPGMDGFEFYQRMRALPGYEKTPVIFVTAHIEYEARAKALLAQGGDVIIKPVLPTELAVKVMMHLMRSHLPGSAT